MHVFRCISNREITDIYKQTGNSKAPLYGVNTYQYDKSKSYIHFFRFYELAEYYKKRSIKEANKLDKYVLVMTADIPGKILQSNLGYGFYSSVDKRINCHICPVPEYRIETNDFKNDYIVEVGDTVRFENRNRKKEYEDYICLINSLGKKYHYDYSKVVDDLAKHDLNQLLGVSDNHLEEEQIRKVSSNQLIKR